MARPTSNPVPRPYFLHGWEFMAFIQANDDEAIAIRASTGLEGPAIVYNEFVVSAAELEDRDLAKWWLLPSMFHIAYVVLHECLSSPDGVGRFTTVAWTAYRQAVCRHSAMAWAQILNGALREGTEFMADHMANCLFVESGMRDRIDAGGPVLMG
ncbi:hypothetical protein EET67_00740 [Pseudaminobacter arsenicus]|uniref:Uncharacterized protein n=1 Tax=Borborobacter arsenicus TaxID=1851146 RepID=A0A432VBC6_9HYPH|nr:hypothetical protein [Pseudaminobacter arsenicus]RUM99470.1 hypothetical protein EET67_00740 [Pseudaminobacter arsenicus]